MLGWLSIVRAVRRTKIKKVPRAAVNRIHIIEVFRLHEEGRSRRSAGYDRAHVENFAGRAVDRWIFEVVEGQHRFVVGRGRIRRGRGVSNRGSEPNGVVV